MKFSEEDLMRLMEEVCVSEDINISDIPCIDLYMDQVTSFFEDKLGALKRDDEDKVLTKTMINNYAKAKILTPVKNKKYTKENMILLTLIYHLKQVLSINDINSLLTPLLKGLEDKEGSKEDVQKLYSEFLNMKKGQESQFKDNFQEKLNLIKARNLGLDQEQQDMGEMILTVLLLINQANLQKRMAEKIIDSFFKDGKEDK